MELNEPADFENPLTVLAVLLAISDELSNSHVSGDVDIHELGYGHLSVENMNKLLLEACGPQSLEYEEMAGTGLNMQVIEFLLESGADLHCSDPGGSSPLYRSVLHEQLREMTFLLEKGAAVNELYISANDMEGETCLTTAMQLGNHDMVRVLLKHGADVSIVVDSGLMFFCAAHRDADMLRLLVTGGANIQQCHPETNMTLADVSFRKAVEDERRINEYFSQNAPFRSENHSADVLIARVATSMMRSFQGRLDCVKYLLENGGGLTTARLFNRALHFQAFLSVIRTYRWCLSSGISVHFPEDYIDSDELIMPTPSFKPAVASAAAVLAELIRRTRGKTQSADWFLRRLDEHVANSGDDYHVAKLKHLCMNDVRTSILTSERSGEKCFPVSSFPPNLKHAVMLQDLDDRIDRELQELEFTIE